MLRSSQGTQTLVKNFNKLKLNIDQSFEKQTNFLTQESVLSENSEILPNEQLVFWGFKMRMENVRVGVGDRR